MMRAHECPWRRQIGVDGGLNDLGSDGKGFALRFLNPLHPRVPVTLDDVVAVLDHLRASGILICEAPKMASPGVIQARLGLQKGGGNLHPNSTGKSTGNARLSCGNVAQIRTSRAALMKSQWFWDAGLNRCLVLCWMEVDK